MDINSSLLLSDRLHFQAILEMIKSASFGAHSAGEIPVPIPNTAVKPSSADYTAKAGN